MRLLNKINANALQRFFLTGNAGERIVLDLRYMPSQEIWTMSLSQGAWSVNGMNVVGSPNLLRCFKNVIDFGLACVTDNGLDPYFPDQFENGSARLYLLTADEVAQIETTLFS